MESKFRASLSRSQGRNAWAVIFRHPTRIDPNTGKPGLRVRQGLGTSQEVEANKLKDELSELLGDERYWNLLAKNEAQKRFNPRVVEIFFHGMSPEPNNAEQARDEFIPLPTSSESEYRRVLLLGTTGAGKTTLLRQLIGTHPENERFPSTSTAKTTVHDTEVLLSPGPYKAVVTFYSIDEVRMYLNECISEAVLAAYRGAPDIEVLRKLLDHVNQRFRFSYVLGNGAYPESGEDSDDEIELASDTFESINSDCIIDINTTNTILSNAVNSLRTLAEILSNQIKNEIGPINENDQRVLDELFEEELDCRLRDNETFHTISDNLIDEMELRFSLIGEGTIRKTKQGWPQSWSLVTDSRSAFIAAVTRFSSNHAPRYGRLLTPLVNGVRVSGPFVPDWNNEKQPKLILIDGEGLGHTPKSVAALSTSLALQLSTTDAIVLVDNATIPMQAAPVSAIKELITSGNSKKLLLVFTHFDEVKGDNLPNVLAKKTHVLSSAENVLSSIGEELGPYAERAIRGRLTDACFFVGGINRRLDTNSKICKRTIDQLQSLLAAVEDITVRPQPVAAKPVYDRMNLVLVVKSASESFQGAWWPRLGLASRTGIAKEHWKRIWALSRRLCNIGLSDEYDNLRPVADLRRQISDRMYIMLQNPLKWDPSEPTDEQQKQQVIDRLANVLSDKALDLATRRVRHERLSEWQNAFNQSGRGSSFVRAKLIGERILEIAAPVPDVTPSPERNQFLHEVAEIVLSACTEVGARLE